MFLYEEIYLLYEHPLILTSHRLNGVEIKMCCSSSLHLIILSPLVNHHAASLSFANTNYIPTVLSRKKNKKWWFDEKKNTCKATQ